MHRFCLDNGNKAKRASHLIATKFLVTVQSLYKHRMAQLMSGMQLMQRVILQAG